jgi:Asp-tRNA(Asn)/Glu-tRNA(Gln) amidotransferase A subunit family amidase
MPFGIQVMAGMFKEKEMLDFSKHLTSQFGK